MKVTRKVNNKVQKILLTCSNSICTASHYNIVLRESKTLPKVILFTCWRSHSVSKSSLLPRNLLTCCHSCTSFVTTLSINYLTVFNCAKSALVVLKVSTIAEVDFCISTHSRIFKSSLKCDACRIHVAKVNTSWMAIKK